MCISGLIDKAIVSYIATLGSDSLRCYGCLRILEKILDDLKEALKNVPNQNSTIPHRLFHGCPKMFSRIKMDQSMDSISEKISNAFNRQKDRFHENAIEKNDIN